MEPEEGGAGDGTSNKRKVVIIIDALNQLDSAGNPISLEWLPRELLPHVRMVVSALHGEWTAAVRPRLDGEDGPSMQFLEVGALSMQDREQIVEESLAMYRKKLSKEQMRLLLGKSDATKPLYLKVACEELRVSGVYEDLSQRIRELEEDVPALFEQVLERLEGDHNVDLVRTTLGIMESSRAGVTESELLEMLAFLTQDHGGAPGAKTFPRAVWARLFRSLEAYLRPRGRDAEGPLDFFHRQLAKAVRRRYLTRQGPFQDAEKFCYDINSRLAQCFLHRADPLRDASWSGNYRRGISELPYHLLHGRAWKELEATLTDIVFVEAKVAFGLTYDLVADYLAVAAEAAIQAAAPDPVADPTRPWMPVEKMSAEAAAAIAQFSRFVQARAHHLHRRPELTFVAAINQPDSSLVAESAQRRWNLGLDKRPHFSWANKMQEVAPCLMTLAGHDRVVRACAYCPAADQNLIVSASDDSTLKLWDSRTGAEIRTLKGHHLSALCVAFSNCGQYIASGSYDCTVKIWSRSEGLKMTIDCGAIVNAVSFAPEGTFEDNGLLFAALRSGEVRVYTVDTGRWATISGAEMAFEAHRGEALSVAVSPTHIVTCGADRNIGVFDRGGYCRQQVRDHRKQVNSVRFSPDFSEFVSASDDRTARVFSMDNDEAHCISTLTGHKDGVTSAMFSPDGQRVVTVSHDNSIMFWDAAAACEVGMLTGHTGSVFDVDWKRDGTEVITSSFDRAVMVWDVTGNLQLAQGHTARILDVAYSQDGKLAVSASRDRTLKVWNLADKMEVAVLEGHGHNVFGCAMSPDSKRVYSASRDQTVKVWTVETGKCDVTIAAHKGVVYCVDHHPDRPFIATGGEDKLVKFWHSETGELQHTLYGHRAPVRCVAFSPDGAKLASGSEDLTAKLWCARTRRKLATFCGHSRAVLSCAFSMDCKRLLTGGDDGVAIEWSAVNAKQLVKFHAHTAAVVAVAYDSSGAFCLTASTDSLIIAWDTKSREEKMAFPCLARVCSMAASRSRGDAGALVVGDGSGGIYFLTPRTPEEP